MPWKETDVVELRTEFAIRAMGKGIPFVKLCREYGISPKTGYKWKARFQNEGIGGLADQSRRPHSSPAQAGEDVVCRVVELKLAHLNWGPKKICELYARREPCRERPSLSTVKRILDKAGLVERRRLRNRESCGRIADRIEAFAPNDVWSVDFKGWWYSRTGDRIEPLTVRDSFSRYILCAKVLRDGRAETVRRHFERIFELNGLPGAIRSDNGPPFASDRSPLGLTQLSAWWVALGINLDRIRPGHPQENGAHERMHRDIAVELESDKQDAEALEIWRHEYNHERPHEALGMKMPAEIYRKSERRFEAGALQLEYEDGFLRRTVHCTGTIQLDGAVIRIGRAFAGWDVGVQPIEAGRYAIWFGKLRLGEVDLECESFKVMR